MILRTPPCIAEHKEPIPVSSVVGDIRNFEDVSRALTGVDVVYHTAAIISWRMFPDYKGMEDVNVEGKILDS